MDNLPPTFDPPQIERVTGVEAVRRRPGMYIGGTDLRALHHLIYEVMDNAVEEHMSGTCSRIELILKPDAVVTIRDNSAGLPIAPFGESEQPICELVFTELHWQNDLLNRNTLVSGGLHGVGLAAVNALSEWMVVEIARDGYIWQQTFEAGIAQVPLTRNRALEPNESTGTTITYRPDFTILAPNEFLFDQLNKRCRQIAYQFAGLTTVLRDEREIPPREVVHYTPDGLKTLVNDLRAFEHWPLHDTIHQRLNLTAPLKPRHGQIQHVIGLEYAFQFTDGEEHTEISFTNSVQTMDGGTHIQAMRSGIVKGINHHRPTGVLPFQWRDVAPSVIAVISIRHPEPRFESPTKVKLFNRDIIGAITKVIAAHIDDFAVQHPDQMRHIIGVCQNNRYIRTWR